MKMKEFKMRMMMKIMKMRARTNRLNFLKIIIIFFIINFNLIQFKFFIINFKIKKNFQYSKNNFSMRINNFSNQITVLKTFPTDRPGRPGRPRKQADGPSDQAVGPAHFLGRPTFGRAVGPFGPGRAGLAGPNANTSLKHGRF